MKKLDTLSVTALKGKLFDAFMLFTKKAISVYEILQQWFPFFVSKFMAAYEQLDDAFLKYDVDACTRAVQDADDVRTKAFRKMRDVIKLYVTYPETPEKTQAAEELLRIIDLYGGIYIPSQGMAAKTASLTNLLDDFEQKQAREVELLGIGAEVEALKQAQAVFDEKYMARDECESETAKGAMAEARKKMTEAYRLLVDAVNVKVYEDPEGKLTPFINLMNVEIGRYRTYTGQGQVGSTGTNTDEEEDGAVFKNATFHFANGNVIKLRVEVGAPLEALPNTPGLVWQPEVLPIMPNRNIVFREVPIEAGEATATFHFFDHTEEVIKQVIGTALTAPQNTTGYYWSPDVPATMPAEDTSYYELPIEQEGDGEDNENQQPGNGENNENQQPGGEQGGGDQNGGGTNTPSGPNTDAWGDGDEGDGSDV